MAKLMVSAFSDEYADSFPEQLAAMNRLGVEYIELRFVDKKNVSVLTSKEIDAAAALLRAAGIRVSAVGSPLGKVALDSDLQTHLELTRRLCDLACRVGTEKMRIFSFYLPKAQPAEQFRGQVIDRLGCMLDVADSFSTIHNYIDLDRMILRKGAISAKAGERLIIPMNMRDGCLLCIGKGNTQWNESAPHGAGRLMSRADALHSFTLSQYKKEMKNIYTTSVSRDTLDESPMA